MKLSKILLIYAATYLAYMAGKTAGRIECIACATMAVLERSQKHGKSEQGV